MNTSLKFQLGRLAARQRRLRFWLKLAACWAVVTLAALAWLFVQRQTGWDSALALPLLVIVGAVAAVVVGVRHGRVGPDWSRLARELEVRHPELDGRLVTAVQQEPGPGGEMSYLQERVIWEALQHSHKQDWAESVSRTRLALAQMAHWLALVCLALTLPSLRAPKGTGLLARTARETSITVTPGDTSLERGSSLVVLARFPKTVPAGVELVVGHSPNQGRIPLVKSLADPLFGGSLAEVSSNLVYHVAYAGQRTRDFTVTVFEYPRLERADLQLTFPAYTGLAPKRIENTRRLSAVEGTHVDLALRFNKAVAAARLVPKNKAAKPISLAISSNQPAAELSQFRLDSSQTYELQLLDAEGRSNKVSAQFVFDALSNRVPELRLASPRGDLRPSPLEEITFEGTVWDDFGVKAYGLGYATAGQEVRVVELGQAVPAKEKRSFKHVLRLEELELQPDQLVSWFVWADDIDASGQLRHTTGDLYFGEIRPFDEVFREGQSMAGEGGGQSGEQGGGESDTAKLTELQKQIISATWKLQRGQGGSNQAVTKPRGQTARPMRVRGAIAQAWRADNPGAHFPSPQERATPAVVGGGSLRQIGLNSGGPAPAGALVGGIMGQVAPSRGLGPGRSARDRLAAMSTNAPAAGHAPTYAEDIEVVRAAQEQALEQLRQTQSRAQDPRAAVLVSAAVKELEKALALLEQAATSREKLPEALSAEQTAYEALLKLQEHEYQVTRSRNRRQQGGGGRNQQMQRQLEEMEMTQSENRYETQRQAQALPAGQRGEQLQAMNRLQELARRQQDLNDRLKELQTALQEARTEEERDEIQRRLKRLQEEEQQMLADVDELRQRMERPENQSRMSEERRQLEQTRNDVQRAAEAAGQGAASQALAAGTRAQRQLQQMREQMRKENSSQFAEEMRNMRSQARELSRRQEEIIRQTEAEARAEKKSLSDSPERQALLRQLEQQRGQMTNLVERATQLSEQAESAEPLLSRQLYDTVRKFTQDSGKEVKDLRDQLLSRGLMTRSLYDRLNDTSQPEGAKLQEVTSEMLRQGFPSPASQAAQRARPAIDHLRRGVERAAESVLGDDTEALRLAQQELDKLTEQLEREIAQASGAGAGTNVNSSTNAFASPTTESGGQRQTNRLAGGAGRGDSAVDRVAQARPGQTSPDPPQAPTRRNNSAQGRNGSDSAGGGQAANGNEQAQNGTRAEGTEPGGQGGQRSVEGRGQRQAARNGRPGDDARGGAPNAGRPGGTRYGSATAGGGEGGDMSGSLRRSLDRLLDEGGLRQAGPVAGDDFVPWSDRLREVEEMIEMPELRNEVATAREQARQIRQQSRTERKKPDWAVVRLQVIRPLVEVRERIAEELAQRASREAITPIDRDPVPNRYSELVRRYYEELGKEK